MFNKRISHSFQAKTKILVINLSYLYEPYFISVNYYEKITTIVSRLKKNRKK